MTADLLEKFNSSISVDPSSGCWIWTGALNPKGYGKLNINSKKLLAHRVSWLLFRGEIPTGMCICHKCDNPPCVNPGHLFLGTRADNSKDMVEKKRSLQGERAPSSKLNAVEVAEILSSSETLENLANRYGVSFKTISAIRRRKIWKHIETDEIVLCELRGHRTGERHKWSKLTVLKVKEIKASTLSCCELGRIHGVDPDTIKAIKVGRTWKFVEP